MEASYFAIYLEIFSDLYLSLASLIISICCGFMTALNPAPLRLLLDEDIGSPVKKPSELSTLISSNTN
jgi:hypothetical protein